MEQVDVMGSETILDCIVIGAGPGGLQACIHLGRYNFRVLLFHIPGGGPTTRNISRTTSAFPLSPARTSWRPASPRQKASA